MIISGYSFTAFIVCFEAGVFFIEEKFKFKTKFLDKIGNYSIKYKNCKNS